MWGWGEYIEGPASDPRGGSVWGRGLVHCPCTQTGRTLLCIWVAVFLGACEAKEEGTPYVPVQAVGGDCQPQPSSW